MIKPGSLCVLRRSTCVYRRYDLDGDVFLCIENINNDVFCIMCKYGIRYVICNAVKTL